MDIEPTEHTDGHMVVHECFDASRDKLVHAAIADIEANPYQYREDWGDLPGLAKSIAKIGIITTPFGRPNPGTGGKPYQLAAGERRLRAAAIAGLTHIPLLVRPMGDDEMIEVLFQENLNRKDTTPLEEARGFKAAIDRAYTVEQLMAKTGRSRGHIYGRMKLLELAPAAMKALQAGELPVAHAELVARIADLDAQERCTREVLGKVDNQRRDDLAAIGIEHEGVSQENPLSLAHGSNEYPPRTPQLLSFRATKELIRRRYMTKLATASFDPNDASLLPITGACTPCAHRAGNQPALPGLVEAGKGDDYCTKPTCFEAKTTAAFKREAARAAERGVKVLDGANDTRVVFGYNATDVAGGSPYVDPSDKMPSDLARAGATQTWSKALGKKLADVPRVLVADGTGAPRELLDREAAVEHLRELGKIDKPTKPGKTAAKESNKPKPKRDEVDNDAIDRAAFSRMLGAAAERSEPKSLKGDLAHWRWMTVVLLGILGLDERNAVAARRGLNGDALRKAILKAGTVVEVRSIHIELLMATQMGAAIYGADDPDERKDFETAGKLFGLSWEKAQRLAKDQAKINADLKAKQAELQATATAAAKVKAAKKPAPKKIKPVAPTAAACNAVALHDDEWVCARENGHDGRHMSEVSPGGTTAMWSIDKDGRETGKYFPISLQGRTLKQSGGWSAFADKKIEKKLDKGLAAIASKEKKGAHWVNDWTWQDERGIQYAGSTIPRKVIDAKKKADAKLTPKKDGLRPFGCTAMHEVYGQCLREAGHTGDHQVQTEQKSTLSFKGKPTTCGAYADSNGESNQGCVLGVGHKGQHENGRVTWGADGKPTKKKGVK